MSKCQYCQTWVSCLKLPIDINDPTLAKFGSRYPSDLEVEYRQSPKSQNEKIEQKLWCLWFQQAKSSRRIWLLLLGPYWPLEEGYQNQICAGDGDDKMLYRLKNVISKWLTRFAAIEQAALSHTVDSVDDLLCLPSSPYFVLYFGLFCFRVARYRKA